MTRLAPPARRARALALTLCLFPTLAAAGLRAPLQEAPEEARALRADGALRNDEGPAEDPRLERKKRLLKTASGDVLRAAARWREGRWEVAREGEWVALPAGAVSSWKDEAAVLSEARALAREVESGDHERRVALATWMLDQGLEEEALEELDRVLAEEPDHGAAVRLLAEGSVARPRAGDPAVEPALYFSRLFGAALPAGPARRELCVQALGELLEIEGGRELLRARLRRELGSYRVLRRVTAAHGLRRLLPGEEVRELLRRCALDPSRPVRASSALALRATDEPGIVAPLVRALSSDSRAVRTNAAESLGQVGFPVAVPALVSHFANLPQGGGGTGPHGVTANLYVGREFAYVGDFDVEIAQASSIADPIVTTGREGVVLDARLGGISGYTYRTEYRVVRDSLRRLSGANPGSSPADWQRWLAGHEERFRDPRATE